MIFKSQVDPVLKLLESFQRDDSVSHKINYNLRSLNLQQMTFVQPCLRQIYQQHIKILTREDKQLSLNMLRKGTNLKKVFMKITSEQMVKIIEE